EHRRVAIAYEDLLVDILRQQWPPAHGRRGMLDCLNEDARNARAEILREIAEECGEVLLRCRRDSVALGAPIPGNINEKAVTGGVCVDAESQPARSCRIASHKAL